MNIDIFRYSGSKESTLGLMFIDGVFMCYTLEDEHRDIKVSSETRIPEGSYEITLRSEGGHHQRYLKKFGPDFHRGMLWVRNVPNFEWILIHMGNHDDHTAGCLLVGSTANINTDQDGFIGNSLGAYKKIYPIISNALVRGEIVTITYLDEPFFNN